MILTQEQLLDLLNFDKNAGATSTDPKLKSAKVALIVNNLVPTVNTLWADLVEASWTGYARSAVVTWANAIKSNQTLIPALVGDSKTFTVTTQADPEQLVYAYALVATISAVDHLLAIKPLVTPFAPQDGTEVIVQPRFGVNQQTVDPSGDVSFT